MALHTRRWTYSVLVSLCLASCGGGGESPNNPSNSPETSTTSAFLNDRGQILTTTFADDIAVSAVADQGLSAGVFPAAARKIYRRSLNTATGVVTNGAVELVIYTSASGVSVLSVADDRTSTLTTAPSLCRVLDFTYDFRDPAGSLARIDDAGSDGDCSTTGDATQYGLRLGSRAAQTPIVLPNCITWFPMYSESGDLLAVVCVDVANGTLQLTRYSPSLSESQPVAGFQIEDVGTIARFTRNFALSPTKRLIGFNRLAEQQDVYVEYDENLRAARTLATIDGVDRRASGTARIDDLVAGDETSLYLAAGNRVVTLRGDDSVTEIVALEPTFKVLNLVKSGDYLSVVAEDSTAASIKILRVTISSGYSTEQSGTFQGSNPRVINASGDYVLVSIDGIEGPIAVITNILSGQVRVFNDAEWLGTVLQPQSASNLQLPLKVRKSVDTGLLFGWQNDIHVIATGVSGTDAGIAVVRRGADFPMSEVIPLGATFVSGRVEPFGDTVLLAIRQRDSAAAEIQRRVYWLTTGSTPTMTPTSANGNEYLMLEQLQ